MMEIGGQYVVVEARMGGRWGRSRSRSLGLVREKMKLKPLVLLSSSRPFGFARGSRIIRGGCPRSNPRLVD